MLLLMFFPRVPCDPRGGKRRLRVLGFVFRVLGGHPAVAGPLRIRVDFQLPD